MWDERFEKTCPACDNTEKLGPPAQPLLDENKEPYPLECPECGMQWAPAQWGWPDKDELVDSSIREVLCDWGQNPRAEEQEQRDRAEQAARAAELRANPPTAAEAWPLPWVVSKRWPKLLVPPGHETRSWGASVDAEDHRRTYLLDLAECKTDGHYGVDERQARANALRLAQTTALWAALEPLLGEQFLLDVIEGRLPDGAGIKEATVALCYALASRDRDSGLRTQDESQAASDSRPTGEVGGGQ